MAYPNWQQFNNGSSAYLGADQNGLGIPLWMQGRFGGGQDSNQGGQSPSGASMGIGTSSYRLPQNRGAGGSYQEGLDGYRNEQDLKSVDANSNFNSSAEGSVPSGASRTARASTAAGEDAPAVGATVSNSTVSANTSPAAGGGAPAAGGGAPAAGGGAPAAGGGAPAAGGGAPAASAPTVPYSGGLGSPVTNGWYTNNDPTNGGKYAGEANGKPIYYHYGNQTAENQFASQYPGRVAPTTGAAGGGTTTGASGGGTTTGAAGSGTTTASASSAGAGAGGGGGGGGGPYPNGNSFGVNTYGGIYEAPVAGASSRLPIALGGTQTASDFLNNIYQTNAGFGDGVPEEMGGTMRRTVPPVIPVVGRAGGGAVHGYNDGGDTSHPMGLVRAAKQIASYGQNGDDTLAHISREERDMLDRMQGGRRTNPVTGLPQYSLLGDIFKAVARIGVTIGAGVLTGGNPFAMAAANAAVSKATGSSWKDSLISGALTGITAGVGNYANGGNYLKSTSFPGITGDITNSVQAAALPAGTWQAQSALGQGISQGMNYLGTSAGAAIGLGNATSALSPSSNASNQASPAFMPTKTPYNPNYFSDDYRFGVGKHSISGPNYAPVGPKPLGINDDSLTLQPVQFSGGGGVGGIGASQQDLMNKSDWGYVNAKDGGNIHGPGTGTSDDIPALLSDGEHVTDAQTINDLGGGDNNLGQKRMERIKQTIRRKAGRANPKSPKSPMAHGLSHYAHA